MYDILFPPISRVNNMTNKNNTKSLLIINKNYIKLYLNRKLTSIFMRLDYDKITSSKNIG